VGRLTTFVPAITAAGARPRGLKPRITLAQANSLTSHTPILATAWAGSRLRNPLGVR